MPMKSVIFVDGHDHPLDHHVDPDLDLENDAKLLITMEINGDVLGR